MVLICADDPPTEAGFVFLVCLTVMHRCMR